MSILKIDSIYLYTGLTSTGGDACGTMHDILTANKVEFTHLHYGDPKQHPEVFNSLSTWTDEVEFKDFPFVIYDEVDSDYVRHKRYIMSVEALKASNIANLYKLGR